MLPAYGVTIGTYDHSGSHQGQWLHELLYLTAGGTLYECAVDVNEPTGIFQYMILRSLARSDSVTPKASCRVSLILSLARSG